MTESRTRRSQTFLGNAAVHAEWETDFLNADLAPFYEAALARVDRALRLAPGDRLLDAGCGSCVHAARFAARGVRVVGVDFSAAALGTARRLLAREGLDGAVALHQADLLALPFRDESFARASCWGVLMHVPEPERALAELARVLAPGGRLALMENNVDSLHHRFVDRGIRATKWLLGRRLHEWRTTPRGLEEWREQEGGGLMVRRTDIDWLVARCGELGLGLQERFAGQLTEIYTSLPAHALKRAVYALNRRYFERGGAARWALGNVLIFEKKS